jgi:hypothetical protein
MVAMAVALVLSGAQVGFLRASIYIEVCLWGAAFGAIFVYGAVTGMLSGRFDAKLLTALAVTAGLALNTRVSVGMGLYAALGFLLLAVWIQQARRLPRTRGSLVVRLAASARTWQLLLPVATLLLFMGLTGFINFQRWGDPLTFAPYLQQIAHEPDRLALAETFGTFNLQRVPFGLVYYFFPIWALFRGDGKLFLEEEQLRLLDMTELPPSSFLLTDALLVLLLAYGALSLLRRRGLVLLGMDRVRAVAIACGLAVPCLLMLTAIWMNYRYRLDFYAFLEFGAFLGVVALARHRPRLSIGWRAVVVASVLVSVATSHLALLLLKMSPYGWAVNHLHEGGLYEPLLQRLPF